MSENIVKIIPEDVFFTYLVPFLSAKTIFSTVTLLSKEYQTFIKKNEKSIHLILWNGPKPPWAIRDGWSYTQLNRMHYNILYGKGFVSVLKYEMHKDKIIALNKLTNSAYISVCFSGSVQVFSKDFDNSLQQFSINRKSIAQNYVRSFTTCAVLKANDSDSLPKYFICGGKNGSIVVWPFDSSGNILEAFVTQISDVHIRSMSSLPNNATDIFVADGRGVVRLVEITSNVVCDNATTAHKYGNNNCCKIKYKWDIIGDNSKNKYLNANYSFAITCMRTLENKMVCCTKKRGLYVFDKALTNGGKKKWTQKLLFSNNPRFVDNRNITCLEFLTPNIVVIGTRGASMTGSNSLILKLLKDECVFAVNLTLEEIIWSLPVRRSVSTVIPLKENIVIVSSDLEGIQIWDTETIQLLNKIEQSPKSMWFANVKFASPGKLIGTIDGDIVEITFKSNDVNVTEGDRKKGGESTGSRELMFAHKK
jgi:WD40 repeat protein